MMFDRYCRLQSVMCGAHDRGGGARALELAALRRRTHEHSALSLLLHRTRLHFSQRRAHTYAD